MNAEGDLARHAVNTGNYASRNLNEFVADFTERVEKHYEVQVNKSFHIDFNFVLIPQGGACSTKRDEASILNERRAD